MIRPALSVDQLEDRTTPVSLRFSTSLAVSGVITPPQDPMDNPPPTQPGTGGTTPTSPPVTVPPVTVPPVVVSNS